MGVEGEGTSSKLMQAIQREVAEGGSDVQRSPRGGGGYRDQGAGFKEHGPGFTSGDIQGVLHQQQGINGLGTAAPAGSDEGLGDAGWGGRKMMAPGVLGGGGGGVAAGEFTSSMKVNVLSEAAAAGDEVIFRPNPAENAPGMVPHARHLGAV
jgi:hypothetical protein